MRGGQSFLKRCQIGCNLEMFFREAVLYLVFYLLKRLQMASERVITCSVRSPRRSRTLGVRHYFGLDVRSSSVVEQLSVQINPTTFTS